MPRGSKAKYTDKQKRQAEHIEEGYESRGTSKKEAERRAWATVNKSTGGGKKKTARAGARRPTKVPPRREANSEALPLQIALPPNALHQPARQPGRARRTGTSCWPQPLVRAVISGHRACCTP